MTTSFRFWFRKLGGHVHVRVFSSEFGPATTHGNDGTLTMRPSTWDAFRALLEAGSHARIGVPVDGDDPWSAEPFAAVEFVDESGREMKP